MHANDNVKEKVILVAVDIDSPDECEGTLAELADLVKTAGAETVGYLVQKRDRVHPGTYIGSGKIEELAAFIEMKEATGIVCDDELSPAQMNNLEQQLHIKVMDRTLIILDIFAGRASTSEGKIQVELAQLRYSLTRLAGFGKSMSRLGGGIGTRGPGEKKLEMDRRIIKNRISSLKKELSEVVRHREVNRASRERKGIKVAAIVGYTNAGKSTLLNHLTGADVLEEDKLFATLDPTTRLLRLQGDQEILLTDTVGFINKLPHHLIQAFRSTLEEAKYADYIIHVVDASDMQMDEHMRVTYETLSDLEITGKPIITVFNKCDKVLPDNHLSDPRADKCVRISALNNQGLEDLCDVISDMLRAGKEYIELVIPYVKAGLLSDIRADGELISEEYTEDGISIKAYVSHHLAGKIANCL